MGDPDRDELEALAAAIEAGTDDFVLPDELLRDDLDPGALAPDAALYVRVQQMTVGERIKLALRGNKEARGILSRDGSRLVRLFVLRNPRITDGEVVTIARNRSADEEAIRMIADNREWVRHYPVRLALAQNPKTPVPIALRQVDTLVQRDVAQLAKSRNVPQVVAVYARRRVVEQRQG